MRSLSEVLDDLNKAEKEYAEKCKKYGIEEKHKKKKEEVSLNEDSDSLDSSNDINELVKDANINGNQG